jgi:hypothetical protein
MAAAAMSKGGAILFTGTSDTYSKDSLSTQFRVKAIALSGGSAAGAVTLKEGVDANGLADASGEVVATAYLAIGAQQVITFNPPLIVNKGLKPSAMTAGSYITAYLE